MYQSRDEIRQVYLDVWSRMQARSLLEPMESLIADVIELHPEYHKLLDDGEEVKQQDYTPELGQTNPFLHMGMHIALREQVGNDRPAGIKSIYAKLIKRQGQHRGEHAMIECLGQSLWTAQRNDQAPDEDLYLACLKKL